MKIFFAHGGAHSDGAVIMADDPLFLKFLDTAAALEERLDESLQRVGLSRAKLAALQQLRDAKGSVPLRALAEGLGCVPSNVTTLVSRLESEGLVRRLADPADRRSILATITPLGEERATAGVAAAAQVQRAFATSLRPTERVALARVLGSLSRV